MEAVFPLYMSSIYSCICNTCRLHINASKFYNIDNKYTNVLLNVLIVYDIYHGYSHLNFQNIAPTFNAWQKIYLYIDNII